MSNSSASAGWLGAALVSIFLSAPLAAQQVGPPAPASAMDMVAPPRPFGRAAASVAQAPLLLDELLASSRFHAPQVLEALAKVRGAQGRLISTQAAFDTVFSTEVISRVTGFYDGTYASANVTQPLTDNGGYVYGGYRISSGRFPTYEDQNFTNQAGEFAAGAVFALLRDRAIDERRFARSLAEADIALAEADRLLIAIGVQRQAIAAYNSWVTAGLRLHVYRDLLALAEARQAGFRRQVDEGARPRILLTENEQNIRRRQSLVVGSEQALAQAAASLSLFLRDADGQPILVGPERLPAVLPPLLGDVRLRADREAILSQRPDLRNFEIRIRAASQRLELDRNSFLPRLDFKAEASRDVGPIGSGGRSRDGTESKVGITLTLPLQQSAARGRLAQTNAELDAFRQRRRLLEDQIGAEVTGLGVAVAATERLRVLAEEEQALATTMAGAERRRFEAGASDFFLVNVREEAAADAQVRALDAATRQVSANAELAAVTVDLDALGL